LYHLMTPIVVKSHHEISFKTAIGILHPTAALGAYPQKEGGKWLKEQEYDRNFFGSPFGLLYQGQAKCLVAIRQVEYTPKNFSLIAGCGILQESDEEREWQEWKWKIGSIQKLCGLKMEL
jgi:isochorismate synthase EntC